VLENINIFTYGSLMFSEVSLKVMKGRYEKVEARLYGYVRKRVKHETYPAVFRGSGNDYVDGIIYLGVTDQDITKLDRFEGEYYKRELAECRLLDGSEIFAYVFVFKEKYLNLIGDEDWDPDWFARFGMSSFLTEYRGFD
jgi:gamma-glutamylcyclotransferase (GGCT)/AIG2-like uncharacterized protein YtfP